MPKYSHLPKAPLAEALFEMKWGQEQEGDTRYPVIVGRLHALMKDQYKVITNLPVNQVPANLTMHFVRHQLRPAENVWPVVQIGPGVLTVNETKNYRWENFKPHVLNAISSLYQLSKEFGPLPLRSMLLRYINVFSLETVGRNSLEFLSRELKTNIKLPKVLFEEGVDEHPLNTQFQIAFPSKKPLGIVQMQLGSGTSQNQPAFLWDLRFLSIDADLPRMPEDFSGWLEASHELIEKWFFSLSEGSLLNSFLSNDP
jgi:uncharacterized protein (TIGR04255 family)